MKVDAPWEVTKCPYMALNLNTEEAETSEFALEEYNNVWLEKDYSISFEDCVLQNQQQFIQFCAEGLTVPERYAKARELALYLNWSAIVHPAGFLKRDAMLMSKNWMTNVWSWDHCFNAMALAKQEPQLAWEQFLLPFDCQDDSGALPDCVSDANIIRNFVKPPIHGLILQYLMDHSAAVGREQLEEVYEPLKRWTRWWFDYRDSDADGIPEYRHGNDSGWDNSTVFRDSPVIEGADLSAFLVIQLEVLAKIAGILGKPEDAVQLERQSKELLSRMLTHFTVDGVLKSMQSGSHVVADGDSLFDFLPVVLGKRLPLELRLQLVQGLKQQGRFFTENGLATESISSPYYLSDGYWRGPIWAPATFLLEDQ